MKPVYALGPNDCGATVTTPDGAGDQFIQWDEPEFHGFNLHSTYGVERADVLLSAGVIVELPPPPAAVRHTQRERLRSSLKMYLQSEDLPTTAEGFIAQAVNAAERAQLFTDERPS